MGLFTFLRSKSRSGNTTNSSGETGDTPKTPRYGYDLLLPSHGDMTVGTVYRCVNLLADSVAKLPVRYMRYRSGVFFDDLRNPLQYLLNVEPCSYLSSYDFWRMIVYHLHLRGNAYVVPVYDEVTPSLFELRLVDPSCVSHYTLTDRYFINDINAGISGWYNEDEIIHLKNYTNDGKTGISTLTYARMAMDIAATGDKETLNRFTNGGNVRGIVGNAPVSFGTGDYQDSQLTKLASRIDERFSNGEKVVALPGQVQFTPLSLSSQDLQFLESRKFEVVDICRFFGVPPYKVFVESTGSYKSPEMADMGFLNDSLGPLLKKIESEFSRKLISREEFGKKKIQFNRAELTACDIASMDKHRLSLLGSGRTINEIRLMDNLPPVEGGDEVLVSANLKKISELASQSQNNQNLPGPNDDKEDKDDKEDE